MVNCKTFVLRALSVAREIRLAARDVQRKALRCRKYSHNGNFVANSRRQSRQITA